MSTWSPADIVSGEPVARIAPVRVAVRFQPDELQHLDQMAAEAACTRSEIARRLLVDVIIDDQAAERENTGGRP